MQTENRSPKVDIISILGGGSELATENIRAQRPRKAEPLPPSPMSQPQTTNATAVFDDEGWFASPPKDTAKPTVTAPAEIQPSSAWGWLILSMMGLGLMAGGGIPFAWWLGELWWERADFVARVYAAGFGPPMVGAAIVAALYQYKGALERQRIRQFEG